MGGRAQGHAPAGSGRAVGATERFTLGVPPFSGFGDVGDTGRFVPLPDDWSVGVADVVASTEAIGAGRYRSVNTAGAAVVSAVSNALGTLDFPFIFAGDGASFAVASGDAERAAEALAATITWVEAVLGLRLRGAVLPMTTIRAEGLDVQVARFRASPDATYAMFAGGGLAWAEQRLKAGLVAMAPGPPDRPPDLSGLSCRFSDIRSKNGVILSMLVRPGTSPDDSRFRGLVADILALAEQAPAGARPIPVFAPLGGVDWRTLPRNARLRRAAAGSRLTGLVVAFKEFAVATAVLGLRLDLGGFSSRRYLREVVENSDFRKYDDGLLMTLDCSAALADRLAERLEAACRAGVAVHGLHRQAFATVTCVVPSASQPNHIHFIDGGSGGYAMAAADLKTRLAVTKSA